MERKKILKWLQLQRRTKVACCDFYTTYILFFPLSHFINEGGKMLFVDCDSTIFLLMKKDFKGVHEQGGI